MSQPKDMLGRSGLTPVSEARKILLSHLENYPRKTEIIPIEEALNRVLASPVTAKENLPPHPRSLMDGFAVIAADTFGASESMPCYLQITGNVQMGEIPQGRVERGCCFRIATGGFLPEGADAVIMHEHTVPVDETMIEIVKGGGAGTSIIAVGDDIRDGDEPLGIGHELRPQDLGLLAGLGITEVEVYSKVRVGILGTGDEIIPHNQPITPGKVRDINSVALGALAINVGAEAKNYGIVSDQKELFFPLLEQAVSENDIVLFSGGSSVGVRDLGEQAVEALGPPGVLIHGVKLKPGKPVLIGLSDNKPVFGLPGHPVSALVCFDLFVRPAIIRLAGAADMEDFPRPVITATINRNINSAAGRLDIVRVRLHSENGDVVAEPVLGKSGAISTLAGAHGYFMIDEDSQGISQGSTIKVLLFK